MQNKGTLLLLRYIPRNNLAAQTTIGDAIGIIEAAEVGSNVIHSSIKLFNFMIDSIETDHVGWGVPDSHTVCESSHNANDDNDTLCEDKDEVKQFSTLSDRAPTI